MNFGEAVAALKDGKMIQREGWNGKGLFVFMQVPAIIDKGTVPKMQSLPQSVKDEFQKRFDDASKTHVAIAYENQMAIVNTDNIINGWVPSSSDTLADDWLVYE